MRPPPTLSLIHIYEARERADLFRRFNQKMVEEMVAMAENDAASRVAVFKRTSDRCV